MWHGLVTLELVPNPIATVPGPAQLDTQPPPAIPVNGSGGALADPACRLASSSAAGRKMSKVELRKLPTALNALICPSAMSSSQSSSHRLPNGYRVLVDWSRPDHLSENWGGETQGVINCPALHVGWGRSFRRAGADRCRSSRPDTGGWRQTTKAVRQTKLEWTTKRFCRHESTAPHAMRNEAGTSHGCQLLTSNLVNPCCCDV